MLCVLSEAPSILPAHQHEKQFPRQLSPLQIQPRLYLPGYMSPTGVLTVAQDARARALITAHPDWPRPGITFLSLFNALADAACLRDLVDALVSRYAPRAKACGAANFYIAGVDARGFTLVRLSIFLLRSARELFF